LGHGTLVWSHQPAGGGPIVTASTALGNVANEYSYVLRIPCESQIAGLVVSAESLPLTIGGTIFDRSGASWEGQALTFANPAQASTTIGLADRGRIERVDFEVSAEIVIDVNGLPVDWQLLYFGQSGVDPQADPDGDGMSTGGEYLAGTDPTDGDSALAFTAVAWLSGTVQVRWRSVQGRSYAVQRSSQLLTGYADVATGLEATPPVNVWDDVSAAGGPYFYRLRLEP
jgi:hypothetical protein